MCARLACEQIDLTTRETPYFYNQWLLQALGIRPIDSAQNRFSEAAETSYFGFAPFGNISRPDVATATSRPVYSALNMYRNAAGNPQCGPVSAVFSRRYVGTQALGAPVDTGLFYGTCGHGQSAGSVTPGSQVCLRCDAWPEASGRPLGVPSMLTHLLPPYLKFYNATAAVVGARYPQYNLARLLTRLLSRATYARPALNDAHTDANAATAPADGAPGARSPAAAAALRLNFMEATWGYLELNPALTLSEPSAIVLLIGTFDLWFGNANGTRLREWCVQRGWALAWSHEPLDSLWRCGVNTSAGGDCTPPEWTFAHGVAPANTRLLDPAVLPHVGAGHNQTNTAAFARAAAAFAAVWANASAAVPADAPADQRRRALDPLWRAMLSADGGVVVDALGVEPTWAGACAAECVGVRVVDGSCVCDASAAL